jgi:MFS family permease
MNTPAHARTCFNASCVALVVTAMSFALRGGAMSAWTQEFQLTNEQVGWVSGTAFWGFTLAMIFGGPLCDLIGMKRIAQIAFFGHAAAILTTCLARDFNTLYIGTLLFGIANGSVEAACNPLIATLYPNNKTTKLNNFHVWFPGGIVIGSVLAYALSQWDLGWRLQFAILMLPTAWYGWRLLSLDFPATERVQSGISTGDMFKATLHPLFLVMVVCMLMTASTELGPNQWIPTILSHVGVSGILVLAYINGLMALGRQFAGTFVHRLSPMGMLIASAILSAIGLFLLSHSSGLVVFASATVFALGVCFFWPTMLGYVSERLPATGALGLAIMGGAGMLSVSFVLPHIGKLYDQGILRHTPDGQSMESLSAAAKGSDTALLWAEIQNLAGLEALGKIALLPLLLAVVFTIIHLMDKKRQHAAG